MIIFLNMAFAQCDDKEALKQLIKDAESIRLNPGIEWTRCDYNGKLIDCDKLMELKLNNDPKVDPNVAMP